MSMNWTKEQMQVITLRDRNILVSAAAGSGKTAVLVERIIRRILDEQNPVDIDRLLIVTFTSAAAAEMRERIGNAIDRALEQNPSSSHLVKQASLVHHAQITTIHSFCLNLIRNYFHQVDLEPNFRIAEEGELNLIREDVIAEVLNRNYEASKDAFLSFVECFATGKTDDGLKDMIWKLYHFAMSYPWPKEWLQKAVENYDFTGFEGLLEKPWMKSLMEYLRRVFCNFYQMAGENVRLAAEEDGPLYLRDTAEQDAVLLKRLAEAKSYEEMMREISALQFSRLPSKRGYDGDEEKLEHWKAQRNKIKEECKKIRDKFFYADVEKIMERIRAMEPVAAELVRLTEEFMDCYDAKKREKNILDFNDLEHFALKILIDEETKKPTEAAFRCKKLYEEVMTDEYQDSNLVQESLMQAVSREDMGTYNRFMVGDVKQSIYKFRLARPELFMDKYDRFTAEASDSQKIELRKNFRSRREVIDVSNHIFYKIMKKDLGNVDYNADAALYPAASYPACDDMDAEFLIADSADECLEEAQLTDPIRLEAELVASRIRKMMHGQKVTDKKTGELRDVKYSDIVILLRSFGKYADTFVEVLEQKKIPAHASSKTGYFKTTEIGTVLSLLRILDNPRQDIPLAAVLRSPMYHFSDEELARIKISGEKRAFHCCVLEPAWEGLSEELSLKLQKFLRKLSEYRDMAPVLPIHELLYRILEDTGYARYVAAMPGGERRKANIEMLLEKALAYEKTSYRGLFHFIRYIDKLNKYEVDYGEADVVSENADAVRIMTIHKSKGLEFPVVFLCGTAKAFNRTDARSRMVIHPELGVALDYIDPQSRTRGATLYKRAVAKQMELENQGEELRVLYVALTRAKEKLILTGTAKDIKDKIEKLSYRSGQEEGLPFLERAGANSFFDWILPAMIAAGDQKLIQIPGVSDFVFEEAREQLEEAEGLGRLLYQMSLPDEKADAYVNAQLSYRYPLLDETNRKTKYSVSELKHRAMEAVLEEEEVLEKKSTQEDVIPYIPRFAGGESDTNQNLLRGTAMHRAAAFLPVEILAGSKNLEKDLDLWIEKIVARGQLTEEMRQLLRKDKLMLFYQSKLALRMKEAAKRKELYVEKPFVMGRTADEIEGDGSDALILVQGIVDAFFIEKEEIVLLDYKTDAVHTSSDLVRRYQRQLELYEEAIRDNLGRKIKEKFIYSFHLNREILI